MTNQFLYRAAFVVLLMFVCVGFSQAQFNETIRTGRPGQSINPYTVGKGMLQLQQGYVFGKTDLELDYNRATIGDLTDGNASTFENVIRYGISENVEINAAVNYQWFSQVFQPSRFLDTVYNGNNLSAADIGARVHLTDNKGLLPDMAVQARLGMAQSMNGDNFQIQNVQITGAFFWQIKERHGVTVNLIPIIAVNEDATSQINYTLAYGLSITDKFGFFIENYGALYIDLVASNQFDTYFDAGFSYLVNNDVQLDVLGGYGTNWVDNGQLDSYFVSAGVSWRINMAK